MIPATLVSLALCAQPVPPGNLPPELRQSKNPIRIDPVIPSAIEEIVRRAALAEMDQKRGPGNAIQILEAGMTEHKGDPALHISLMLRRAAVGLRSAFLAEPNTPEAVKYQKALSTFSKLDIREPQLKAWLDRVIDKVPDAKKTLRSKKNRVIRVAVLTRGSGLDPTSVASAFKGPIEKLGFRVQKTPLKKADYAVTILATEVRAESGQPTVRLETRMEEVENGHPAEWQQSLFRTTEAYSLDAAVAAALDWTAGVAGRELFFHFLSENGLPGALMAPPGAGHGHGHGGHNHGAHAAPRVRIPKGHQHEPKPPSKSAP